MTLYVLDTDIRTPEKQLPFSDASVWGSDENA